MVNLIEVARNAIISWIQDISSTNLAHIASERNIIIPPLVEGQSSLEMLRRNLI